MPTLTGWGTPKMIIAVDHTQVSSTLTDFPLPVQLTGSSGVTGANCCSVFADLWDESLKIHVTEDDDTPCYVEVTDWDPLTMEANLHVLVPSLSSEEDTVLYVYWYRLHADNDTYVGAPGSAPSTEVWRYGDSF